MNNYNLIILGGGISGLSMADACCRHGLSCAVIDRPHTDSGASRAPMGLLNPATGRRAKKSWGAEEALEVTNNLISRTADTIPVENFVHRNGLIRPAASDEIADEMLKQFNNSSWPDGWLEWIGMDEFHERFPELETNRGALWISVASTVSLSAFMDALKSNLMDRGVSFYQSDLYHINKKSDWQLTGDEFDLRSPRLIHATGYGLCHSPEWRFLPLHGVKGQTVTVTLSRDYPYAPSVSSRGYIAVNPTSKSSLVLGSTYEHKFTTQQPHEQSRNTIIKRQSANWPQLTGSIVSTSDWAGVRVTLPDRKPVAGPHPEIENLYILGGMGSKGLLHGPLTANCLADHIFKNSALPDEINVARYY